MKLLSTAEAARRLGISERRIRFFCEHKRFGIRVGGRWVITEAELRTFKRHPKGRPRKKPHH